MPDQSHSTSNDNDIDDDDLSDSDDRVLMKATASEMGGRRWHYRATGFKLVCVIAVVEVRIC